MSNNTSLYSTTSSGNVTIPPNNNTGLYNATGVPATVNNDISVTGNISAAGNITGGNILTEGIVSAGGNIYADNFIGNIIANIQVPGGNTQILYNNNGSANASANLTFNAGTNVLAVAGAITATGNVSGNYFLGNGSQLTGLPATYTNANVVSLLNSFGSNTISTTGNVTAGYFLGDGSQLTNLPIQPGTYSNANVAAYLPTYTGNITGNTVSLTGNITASYVLGDGSQLTNLPVGNYSNANVAAYLPTFTGTITANVVSATGNVTGAFILGDGSQLTNLPAGSYSNANVTALMAAFGSNTISTTGNVTAGFVLGNGSQLTGIVSSYGNANVATFMGAFGSNSISTTGNVTASYVFGNGSQLTGLPATYSNANVATFLAAFGSNTISTTGTVTAGNFVGDGSQLSAITAANVTGTVASANTAATVTTNAQPNITSVGTLSSVTSSGNITGGNILTGGLISATGNVTGLYIKGDGSQLTNLPPGDYSNANVAAYLPVYTGNIAAGNVSATGNVMANVLKTSGATGNIVGANYVSANFYLGDGGYLSNIQVGNIVGAYSNANVANYLPTFTGNLAGGNLVLTANTGNAYIHDLTATGSAYITGVVSAAGNVRGGNINTAGIVTATGGLFTADGITATGNITGGNVRTAGAVTATGNITGTFIIGDGSQLTNLPVQPGTYSNANVANYLPTYSGTITANVVSATGNITGNYFIGNGSQLTGLPASYSNANVSSFLAVYGANTISSTGTITTTANITGGNLLTSGVITATGKITSGNVIYTNVDGTNGQVLTTYGNGVTYFSTVSGGGGNATPGGTNTQIQFNNANTFAGNSNMTFDVATGDIILGNIAINGLRVLPNNTGNLDVTGITANSTSWQMRIGNSFNGNTNWSTALFNPGTAAAAGFGARLYQSDTLNLSNSTGRLAGIASQNFVNLTANVTNINSRVQGIASFVAIGGGSSANTMLTQQGQAIQAISGAVGIGNVNANLNIGNTTANYVAVGGTTIAVGAGSTTNYGVGVYTNMQYTAGTGNIGNVVGYMMTSATNAANANIVQSSNVASFYHPGTTSIIPAGALGSVIRSATNYYAFRNDDALAKAKLGMLDSFHEFNANSATTTGNVTIDKTNGQVQTIYPTGNITIASLTNFQTRVQKPDSTFVNTADTVTLIIQQGATPYTVTMPTGNANIRYNNGLNTVASTANTTTMISITGVYNYQTAANQYLITISGEFS